MQATFPHSYGARLVAIEAHTGNGQDGYINGNGKRTAPLSSVTRQFIADGLNHNHSSALSSTHSTSASLPTVPVKLGLAFFGRQSPGGHDVLAGNTPSQYQ